MVRMQVVRKLAAFTVVLIMAMPFATSAVSADGGMFIHYTVTPSAYERWGLVEEETQLGLINYRNGVQKMIISIKVPHDQLVLGDKAVWLFPIPARPANVTIDLIEQVSELNGKRLAKMAEDALKDDALLISATQVYPFLVALPLLATYAPSYGPTGRTGLGGGGWGPEEVDVYQSIQLFGMTTELVGTNSSSSFYAYLAGKNLTLPQDAEPIVDEYIGKDYSFVASWISNVTEFVNEAFREGSYYNIGVAMSFPTERMFYPLRLTSVYGEDKVPMLVQVVDYVSIESAPEKMHYDVDYLFVEYESMHWSIAPFFYSYVQPGEYARFELMDLKFTEIVIDSEGYTLTGDLWIEDSPSMKASVLQLTVDHSWAVSIPMFLLISMLSSMVSALIVYRGFSPSKGLFSLFGLLSIVTVVGLWLMAREMDINKKFCRKKGVIPVHLINSYAIVFSLLFVSVFLMSYVLFIGILS